MASTNTQQAVGSRTIRFRIKRQDGPGKGSRWEIFDVPVESGANVISCLQWIAANPVTVDGVKTTPVVWESACLEEVCGACTMVINGAVRQSCTCLMDEYAPNDGDVVTLEPMSKFPVVRDLHVDRTRIFNELIRMKAWVPIDDTFDKDPGVRETVKQQAVHYKLSECMSCGCCMEACPQYKVDNHFVGAAIIGQARLFNEHVIGETLKDDRLNELMKSGGIDDCGNAQNCVKVCPKEIPLTEAIGAVGRQMTIHGFRRFFMGD